MRFQVSHDEGGDQVGAGGNAIMCRRERSCIGCRASPHGLAMQSRDRYPIESSDRRCRYFLADQAVPSRSLAIAVWGRQNRHRLDMLYDALMIKILL